MTNPYFASDLIKENMVETTGHWGEMTAFSARFEICKLHNVYYY